MKLNIKIIAVLLFWCVLFTAGIFSQQPTKRNKVAVKNPILRYVVVHNKIDPKISSTDKDRRFIEILIKRSSFSQKNLATIFQLVAKRFPEPETLFINVFTDLGDIQTPEERDQGMLLDFDANGKETQAYPTSTGQSPKDIATFTRHHGKMSFIIRYANGRYQETEIKEATLIKK